MATKPKGSDLPNAQHSARSILLQGIPDPVTSAVKAPIPATSKPQNVAPRTLDKPVTRLPYHTPTPPPSTRAQQAAARAVARSSAAAITKGAKTAVKNVPSLPPVTAGDPSSNAMFAATGGKSFLSDPARVGGGPAPTPAPMPGPTPAPAPAPQANAADPYADLPPEVAALLHAHDAQTNAQANALQAYYGQQSTAAQAFAQQIASQLTGLGNMAGITVAPGAGPGVGGPLAALAPQLSQIGQKLTGAQGFNIANAAAMTPTFLQQAGQNALAGVYGAAQKGTGDVLSQSAQSAGDFAVQELKGQQGQEHDLRQAKIEQARNAISANNAQLGFMGKLLTAAIASGNSAQVNAVRGQIAQLQADTAKEVASIRADASTSVAGINAAAKDRATAATKANKAATAKTGKPATAGTRTAIANAFDRIWNGDPGNFVSGIAPDPDTATPEERAAATTATINFLRRYHDNFPGAPGLAQLMALLPPDAQALAQRWFKGQTNGDAKLLKKVWP